MNLSLHKRLTAIDNSRRAEILEDKLKRKEERKALKAKRRQEQYEIENKEYLELRKEGKSQFGALLEVHYGKQLRVMAEQPNALLRSIKAKEESHWTTLVQLELPIRISNEK